MKIRKSQKEQMNTGLSVKVKTMGNIIEQMILEHKNKNCLIRNLNSEEYVDLRTGEIKQKEHIENRSEGLESVRRTMSRIIEVVNTNITEPEKTLWVTFTYAQHDNQPMTDKNRLYNDFKGFWQRFKRYCVNYGYTENSEPEYISVAEPQGTGSWHLHTFIIFEKRAPFIANDIDTFRKIGRERLSGEKTIAELWSHGYTKTKKVIDADNAGAYFTAYLTDIPLEDLDDLTEIQKWKVLTTGEIQEKQYTNDEGETKSKRFIKGGRLIFYPPKMNIIRISKGIKEPVIQEMSQEKAKEQVQGASLTYSAVYEVVDDSGKTINTIYKSYYNTKRKTRQERKNTVKNNEKTAN